MEFQRYLNALLFVRLRKMARVFAYLRNVYLEVFGIQMCMYVVLFICINNTADIFIKIIRHQLLAILFF